MKWKGDTCWEIGKGTNVGKQERAHNLGDRKGTHLGRQERDTSWETGKGHLLGDRKGDEKMHGKKDTAESWIPYLCEAILHRI